MDLRLQGKRAVVTGGTRGIGRAIAEALAAEGCNIALCARDAAEVLEAIGALQAKGVQASGVVVDVADGEALRAWIRQVGEEPGGIEILFSNPAGGWGGMTPQDWKANFDVDVMGAVNASQAAMPYLERAAAEKGGAAIVATASASALIVGIGGLSYGAMKAALIHLAKGLAHDGAPKHVRANTVSPGMVYFPGGIWNWVEQNAPEQFQAMFAMNPMGRMATPQEVAAAAVFLASPVSAFTSGANLVIDGAATDRVNY
ncbi:MAG: SDR family oxidoreductase [Anaerolineae bacterium]